MFLHSVVFQRYKNLVPFDRFYRQTSLYRQSLLFCVWNGIRMKVVTISVFDSRSRFFKHQISIGIVSASLPTCSKEKRVKFQITFDGFGGRYVSGMERITPRRGSTMTVLHDRNWFQSWQLRGYFRNRVSRVCDQKL